MTRDNISVGSTASLGGATPHPIRGLLFPSVSQLLIPHVGLIIGLVIILAVQYARSPWRKVPPGPKGLPVLGNVRQFQDKSWLFGKDCKQQFEHIMYLNVLGQPIIVLNSLKAAEDLLDRRNCYSDRPRFIVAHEILCGGLLLSFMSYGDLWRRHRRAAQQGFTKALVRDYHPILCKEAILLSSALLENSDALGKHVKRFSASVIMSILYDYPTLENEHDKNVTVIHAFIDSLSAAAVPGAHLVELFPWMIHIPERFAKWKRDARQHFMQMSSIFNELLNTVRSEISEGSERPSMSASLIKNFDRNELSGQDMAWLLGNLYLAGAETTTTALTWWILAMIAHPEIQKRAQAELDSVVGRSRIPTFSDAPSLPYIQALVKETLRWRPPVPLGLPHSTTEDDWYDGMYIPKGTICMANHWQCDRDPVLYGDDASSFNPERFLDGQGRIIQDAAKTRDDGLSAYGFGKRVCTGKYLANDTLFITVATVLWAANLERVRDETGEEVPLDTESFSDNGIVFRPLPYRCKTTPRFPEAHSMIAETIELFKA